MEQYILSKIEWLTEWFMQLFFDPMYFYQTEAMNTSKGNSVSITFGFVKKTENGILFSKLNKPFSESIRVARNQVVHLTEAFNTNRIKVVNIFFNLNTLIQRPFINAKSTLNKVQSAFDILWSELSFQ